MDYYVAGGSMVNLCLLDLSKAFDKMNHYASAVKERLRQKNEK